MEKQEQIDILTREIQSLAKELPLGKRLQILNRCRRIRLRSKGLPDIEVPERTGKASQKEMILEYLQLGHALTPLEALRYFGCFRLGARIADIKKEGYNVHSEHVHDPKTGKRYASYILITE